MLGQDLCLIFFPCPQKQFVDNRGLMHFLIVVCHLFFGSYSPVWRYTFLHLYIRICIRNDDYSQVPKYVSDIENVYTTRDTITVMSTGALAVSGFAAAEYYHYYYYYYYCYYYYYYHLRLTTTCHSIPCYYFHYQHHIRPYYYYITTTILLVPLFLYCKPWHLDWKPIFRCCKPICSDCKHYTFMLKTNTFHCIHVHIYTYTHDICR